MIPRRWGTQAFAEICVVAGVYAALTVLLAPISYGPVQFRLPEILKSLVIWRPHLIAAFVAGNFISNLTSPQAGPWELAFMPAANLIGAAMCVWAGRRSPWLGAAVYAVIIAAAVALMLSVLLRLPYAATFLPLLLSEGMLIVGGVPVMRRVQRAIGDSRHQSAGTSGRRPGT